MKKKNKLGTYEKGLIITGVAVLIIFLILLTADGIKNIGKNKQNLALSEQEKVVPPNVPVLSAGMIPVKYEGNNLIICKNDSTWYNYEAGTPAYMMLNDGVYQSELTIDMLTDDNLASKNIGQVVPTEEQGTIYMWIPRFEINSEEKIKYVQNVKYASDGYEIPEVFTYKQSLETSPDFLLTGIWIEKTPLANASAVTTKITNMTGENNTYGFIANTVGVAMTEEDKTIIGRAMLAPTSETWLPYLRELAPEATEGSIADPNRTTLKILNEKYQDPIKAKVEYNKTTGLIEITVTYSKYGINKITFEDTTELQMTNTNGIIAANTEGITLEPGTYKITITDKNGIEKRLKVKVPLEYGREVLGYECDVPDVKWRLYHEDNNNIYLIADDYIPYDSLPTSTNGTALYRGNTEYKADFRTILNDYTGSTWIRTNTDTQVQKWLSRYLTAYPDSENENMKAVAYMMDTDSWSSFAGDNAEYAIGGPTLELFCASFKETHPDKYIECNSIDEYGYRARWTINGYVYDTSIGNIPQDDFNSIYIKSDKSKQNRMWITSPSYDSQNVMIVTNYGALSSTSYLAGFGGFRPVVCLKSGVGLLDNGDNTYSIKEPIMANIEYKEADGTIEITVRYTENGIAKIEDENGNRISFKNENGTIKAITSAEGGRNKFVITDNKGNTKELEVSVILPIYATLYTDGTLALTATEKTIDGKTVANVYGDISKLELSSYTQQPWNSQRDSITTVDIVDEIAPTSTAFWFSSCTNLTNIEKLANLNTSNVTSMEYMFAYCSNLASLDVSNFDTRKVTTMENMFYRCSSLNRLDLSNFNTDNVVAMRSMFAECSNLTELNISSFNTSNITNMEYMFYMCSGLRKLDVSNFDTSNVTSMNNIFKDCSSLTELGLSSFDTSKLINMNHMFHNCSSLTELDLSNFNTSNTVSMISMFYNCSSLTELDLSSFDTSNVTNMNYMFSDCNNLRKLNISSFNTSNVTSMQEMFERCGSLTELDLSSFNTVKVTSMYGMFQDCTNL